ncbi:MAG: TIM barrel protein [Gemmatimonadaceae bacterium]|nr:TIM barrel protein [Gemmatimonadaceae bacterium]
MKGQASSVERPAPSVEQGRRDFIATATAAAAALAIGDVALLNAQPSHESRVNDHVSQSRSFKLRYAPHFGMFRQHAPGGLENELEFMASEGFTALEDNGLKDRSVADQELIGRTLARLNMRMGVFVAHTIGWNEANLASGNEAARDTFLQQVRDSIPVAQRVNARWMTVVPGHVDRRLEMSYQTAHVTEALKRAAAILEPHGLVIVIEPLNTLRDHPGQFLSRIPQAYQICRAVGSPSLKILFDIYHQQITEGNLIPNINQAWDEVGYFQVGDNPGRREPGTGEINYRNVFRHIHSRGWQGIVGMEHGNSRPGREGERAVIDAYVAADGW